MWSPFAKEKEKKESPGTLTVYEGELAVQDEKSLTWSVEYVRLARICSQVPRTSLSFEAPVSPTSATVSLLSQSCDQNSCDDFLSSGLWLFQFSDKAKSDSRLLPPAQKAKQLSATEKIVLTDGGTINVDVTKVFAVNYNDMSKVPEIDGATFPFGFGLDIAGNLSFFSAASSSEQRNWQLALFNEGCIDLVALYADRTDLLLRQQSLQRFELPPRSTRSWKTDVAIKSGTAIGVKLLDYFFTGGLVQPVLNAAHYAPLAAIPLDQAVLKTIHGMLQQVGSSPLAITEAWAYAYENPGVHKRVFEVLASSQEKGCAQNTSQPSADLLRWILEFFVAAKAAYRTHPSHSEALMLSMGFEALISTCESRTEQPAFGVFSNPTSKTVFVAIRGTVTNLDWITNLRCEPQQNYFPTSTRPLKISSHGAFFRAAVWVLWQIKGPLLKMVAAGYKVRVTGHSYGAAVAVFLAAMLIPDVGTEDEKLRVVVFSAPPMVDQTFATWLRSVAPEDFLTGVLLGFDIVPRLSLGVLGSFDGGRVAHLDKSTQKNSSHCVEPVALQANKPAGSKRKHGTDPTQNDSKITVLSPDSKKRKIEQNDAEQQAQQPNVTRASEQQAEQPQQLEQREVADENSKQVDLIFPGRVLYLHPREDSTIQAYLLPAESAAMHPVMRTLPLSSSAVDHHKLNNVGEALQECLMSTVARNV